MLLSNTTVATHDAPLAPATMTRVSHYCLQGVLGVGGTATVYLARDLALDRCVALKVAGGDGAPSERLLREGRAIARIAHPNVVHVYEVGRDRGVTYVAMEWIAGVTLATWLEHPRPRRAILDVFAAAGRGLAATHAAGLVHRDFKPHNVMVRHDGRVCVLDFGLAIDDDSIGSITGTPAYMSPEQWLGEPATARSDQFSFCVALWQALAGAHPFGASSRDALSAAVVAGDLVTRPRTVPHYLDAVLRRGMARRPCDRFPSLDGVIRVISRGRTRRS